MPDKINSGFSGSEKFYDYRVTFYKNTTYVQLWQDAIDTLRTTVIKVNGYDAVPPTAKPPYDRLYCWDTYFTLLGLIRVNATLAREDINAQLSLQKDDGMIPNAPTPVADQDLRSLPPLLSDAVWQYFLKTHDLESLQSWYPKLEKYYSWYNITGSPGSQRWLISATTGRRNPFDGQTAFYVVASTGMDNHPIYDVSSGRLFVYDDFFYGGYSDLLLSSAMANFATNLALMSKELGFSENATLYSNEYSYRVNAINDNFWDSDGKFYAGTVNWNGAKDTVRSQVMFIPLFANGTSVSNARDLLLHYNADEFDRPFGMPTVAANDSKYYSPQPKWMHAGDLTYWRGNNWVYTTYLVYRGLKNYGFDAQAHDVAKKWVDLVSNSSVKFAEYYDSRDGHGYQNNSDNYTPSAAVTMLFIEEELMPQIPSDQSFVINEGDFEPDFSDFRFFVGNSTLQYSGRIVSSGVSAMFWFRVSEKLAKQPITVYYGNSSLVWEPTNS